MHPKIFLRFWRRLVLVCALLPVVSFAQRAFILSLEKEGTATVYVGTGVAYITDGGKSGSGGAAAALIEGSNLLDYLAGQKVERLVVTCSHPHADHLGGLVALLKQPAIRSFKEIVFVDSGFPTPSGTGNQPMWQIYESIWSGQPGGPVTSHREAAAADVLQGLAREGDGIRASNLNYEPDTTSDHPHGHSIVSRYDLESRGKRVRVVDFDDADESVVAKWIGAPGTGDVNVVIAPHHGSPNNPLQPILEAGKSIRTVVFTVNAENSYGHPGLENVVDAMLAVGKDHVLFSGAGGHVEFGPDGPVSGGVSLGDSAAADRFLRYQIEEAQRRLRAAEGRMQLTRSAGKRAEYARLQREAAAADIVDEILAGRGSWTRDAVREALERASAPKPEPNGTGHFAGAANELDDALAKKPESPPAGFSGGGFAGGGGGGGAPVVEARAPPDVRGVAPARPVAEPGRVGRLGGGGTRFRFSIAAEPIFGGIVLGNSTLAAPDPIANAEILIEDDEPVIAVSAPDGGRCFFRNLTSVELWAAYNFVEPGPELVARYHLAENECSVLGIDENLGRPFSVAWTFNIHPAIANSLIAQDAMRVDMLVANREEEAAEPVFDGIEIPEFKTYQWFDAENRVVRQGSEIRVLAADGADLPLIRLRLWGPPSGDPRGALHELQRRVMREKVVENKLEDSEEYADWLAWDVWATDAEKLDADDDLAAATKSYGGWLDEANKELDRIFGEGSRMAPLATYHRQMLAIRRAVLQEAAQENRPAWATDEHWPDEAGWAIAREIERRSEALTVPGNFARLKQLIEKVDEDVERESEADPPPSWLKDAASKSAGAEAEEGRRVAAAVAGEHLETAVAFRELLAAVPDELPDENTLLGTSDVKELTRRFRPLRRLDDFARLVALLRWIKAVVPERALPKLPPEIIPPATYRPPVWLVRDVVTPGGS